MNTIVLLELQVTPESMEEMKSYLRAALPDTRAYEGCRSCDVYDELEDSPNLLIHQLWDSREHHEKYVAWRTEMGFIERLGTMLAAAPVIRYFDRLDA